MTSTHPTVPPPSEGDIFACLRLLRSRRVGPATYRRMIAEHGSAQAALDALPDVARAAGVSDYQICPHGVVEAEMAIARRKGAVLLVHGTAAYPTDLGNIDDAPPLLWSIGDASLLQKPMIALVGARNASSLGTRMAKKLAGDLSDAGYCIVSGLARGVDTAAHLAAIDNSTVAVMAGGVDVCYPAENMALFDQIGADCLRISEMPMGMSPVARHFPARNRIISGLAKAVVVVEAATKSGSLITARNALDQSRDVFAIPGHPFDARASGCNMLIRDGAALVRNADDVIAALAPFIRDESAPALPLPAPKAQTSLRDVAALHSKILEQLGPSPVAEDQLLRDLGVAPHDAAPALIDLELDGAIVRQTGGMISRLHS